MTMTRRRPRELLRREAPLMTGEARLADLIERFARQHGIRDSTASRLSTGSGDTISRLRSGGTITVRRFDRTVHYLSENWPVGARWPEHTNRPQ